MNCPRCNYPINKDYVWSNCPKCNCRLDRDAAPAQRVKVPQSETPSASATRNVYSSSTNHFEDEYQPRRAAEQKQPKIAYCINCGQKIEEGQNYCFRCGSTVLNPNSVNKYLQPHKKPLNKKVVFSICGISLILLLIIVIIVTVSNNNLSNKLIGDWTTDRGMDSYYLKFKEDGKLIQGDFMDSHTYNWSLDGDTLVISSKYGDSYYFYSKGTDKDTWHLDGNTLYYGNSTYYKE